MGWASAADRGGKLETWRRRPIALGRHGPVLVALDGASLVPMSVGKTYGSAWVVCRVKSRLEASDPQSGPGPESISLSKGR